MALSNGPTLEVLGIGLFGDNFLVAEDLEFMKDEENYPGFDWFSMRPHCRIRLSGEAYGLDEAMYISNFSKPGATLRDLGELGESDTRISGWLKEMQSITILQVGAEDLLRGLINKKEFQEDNKLILKMVRKAIHNLVDIKSKYLQRVAPEKLEFWKLKHHFGIYTLPNLKNYPFDGTKWTFDEYLKVSRRQNSYLKRSKDKEHLKYSVLSPEISNPSFSNRKRGDFPGFPYMKLEENFMKPFVEPILRLVGKRFCSRCREPTLPKSLWVDKPVTPSNGQYSTIHCLPQEVWEEIFRKLTVFDVWSMKETCKGLYRIHHESLRCVRSFVL